MKSKNVLKEIIRLIKKLPCVNSRIEATPYETTVELSLKDVEDKSDDYINYTEYLISKIDTLLEEELREVVPKFVLWMLKYRFLRGISKIFLHRYKIVYENRNYGENCFFYNVL